MSDILNLLDWYKQIGCDNFYNSAAIDRTQESMGKVLVSDNINIPQNKKYGKKYSTLKQDNAPKQDEKYSSSRQIADNARNLTELRELVCGFEGCEVKHTATNTVFGDGNTSADIMFIGEAPGANEDKQGVPFCGLSGKLLNNILHSIGLARESVYITNTTFWRPPGNRRPTAEEIKLCRPFVERHIAFIKPKLIVLVGSTAVESLLEVKSPMGALRGKFFDYINPYLDTTIPAGVIFHPSYLLRQPMKKKLMWEDIILIKQKLEGQLSPSL